jgi:surface polysaccharide O-acyltransferase-like enzyme
VIFQIPPGVYTLCVIALLALVASRIRATTAAARLLQLISTHSYGIFLVHLVVVRLILHRLLPPQTLADDALPLAVAKTLACWFGALVASTAAVALLSRSSWTRPLVSNRW